MFFFVLAFVCEPPFFFTKTIDKPWMSMVSHKPFIQWQWFDCKKPLEKSLIPMVEIWKTIDTNGSHVKKTIEKPSTTMVFLAKTITIPLWSKFYHRSALTKTKSAVLPTSLMSFCTCLEHFNLTNKEIQDEYLLHKISHIRLQTIF